MIYTHEIIRIAEYLESVLVLSRNEHMNLFYVKIPNVWFKEKSSYLKLSIIGKGFTIEDAACDYLRLARGNLLVNCITDKELEPL